MKISIIIIAALIATACVPFRSESQSLPGRWTAFRFNRELNPVIAPQSGLVLRWTFATHGGISSSPTVAGDTVFVAGNDHHVYALDLHSGRPRWDYLADDEVMTAPLVDRGVVIIGEGNNHADESMFFPPHYMLMGDGTNALIGLDEKTGKQLWKRRVPGSAMPTGAIVDDAYVHHDAAGMLFAFGVADGVYRWRQYLGSVAAMVAANRYDGDAVATAGVYPNAVVAVNGRTGRTLWRTPFASTDGGFDDCPLASDGKRLYGTYNARPSDSPYNFVGYTTPAIQHAYALDAASGRLMWDVALIRGILPINNSTAIPMVDGDTLFLGSAMVPAMFALDAGSGKVRWRRTVGAPVKGGVVAKDGTVYFGDLKKNFWALDVRSGSVLGRTTMQDGFAVGSPIIVGSSLIVGTAHGLVLARPLASLRQSLHARRPPVASRSNRRG